MKKTVSVLLMSCIFIAAQEKETITAAGIEFNMVKITAGSFMMGSSNAANEQPLHKITFSNDFFIGETEVTARLYKAVTGNDPSMNSNASSNNTGSNFYPVNNVSWVDADNFCEQLSTKSGRNFTLPTEAQWEYACRAGTKTRFYSGNFLPTNTAWYKANTSNIPAPVKMLQPNPWGLYDMSGNLWEWCADWYEADYYRNSPPVNPPGPEYNSNTNPYELKALRGGSFDNYLKGLRSAYRGNNINTFKSRFIGFRVVMLP
ncbi:MAG TPA: formylglycine-generating enzyme family protein [Spirochaetota bacterium]|nr:formylglycine-generating enzyme family protein [Spirochaetota bacterium]